MPFILSQENCQIKVHSPLGPKALHIDELRAEEFLNDAYEFTALLHAPASDLSFKSLVGKTLSIEINYGKKPRFFTGIVGKIEYIQTIQLERNKGISFYQAKIYPKWWLLKFSKDHKIFQKKSALDIIKDVLSENGVTDLKDETQSSGKNVREYCVQYGESHYDFASRLMEEEGIFYYFTHEKSNSTMVLVDGNSSAKPLEPATIEFRTKASTMMLYNQISELRAHQQITPKGSKVADFDYEKPSTPLHTSDSGDDQDGDFIYDYPGLFQKVNEADQVAKRRKLAHTFLKEGATGTSTVIDFSPFKSFSIKNHPRKSANAKHIVFNVKHRIFNQKIPQYSVADDENKPQELTEMVYENSFSCFSNKTDYKPPILHDKNRIYCSQTAIVTGPSGEEIYTDKYGRIKVKFHWDLKGKKNDKSSCWVRVAQNWAGAQWGGLVIPRIGMEVVVTFLDGDPDRPLVIGCVYNGDKLPPYADKAPTQSTFKSNTSKGGSGFNEIRFDDKKGSEEIYTHAEKDVLTEIVESRTETIEKKDDKLTLDKGSKFVELKGSSTKYQDKIKMGDRILLIDQGNQDIQIKQGNQKISIKQGNQEIKIDTGNHKLAIQTGNFETNIKTGNADIKLGGGNLTIDVTGNIMMKSTGSMMFDAKGPITMKTNAALNVDAKAAISMLTKAAFTIEAKAAITQTTKAAYTVDAGAAMTITTKAAMTLDCKAFTVKSGGTAMVKASGPINIDGGVINAKSQGILSLQASGNAIIKGAMVQLN